MKEEEKTGTVGAPALSGMLEGLLSNPEMLQRVSGIINAMATSRPAGDTVPTDTEEQPKENTQNEKPTAEMNGDGLASVLSNPALLEALPQMIAVMKPLLASMPKPEPDKESPKKQSPEDCRNNLLLALKPFLSPERCDAVDSIIRISKLGAVFQQLK